MEYLSLKSLKFNLNGDIQMYEDEYQKRLNSFSVYHTNLYPYLMKRGQFSTSEFPLYVMNLPILSIQIERIMNKSKRIQELSEALPPLAGRQFFFETLRNEIISTNDIEGIKSTRKEVDMAIRSVSNKSAPVRLSSTAKMYIDVFDDNYLSIKKLSDIRKVYDQLLENELAEDDLPDGEFFRKKEVYIQGNNVDKIAHVAPVGEEEINKRLKFWLEFINQNDIPFMIKALIGHYFFENTHPFYDGNGRIGRYILSMYLSRKLDKFTGISFSQAVQSNKKKYYKAFDKTGDAENRAEATFFVMDLMDLISDSQDVIIEALETRTDNFKRILNRIGEKYPRSVPENYVLFLFAQSKLFNDSIETGLLDKDLRKIAVSSKYSVRSINNAIKKLEDAGVLEKIKQKPVQHVLADNFII